MLRSLGAKVYVVPAHVSADDEDHITAWQNAYTKKQRICLYQSILQSTKIDAHYSQQVQRFGNKQVVKLHI